MLRPVERHPVEVALRHHRQRLHGQLVGRRCGRRRALPPAAVRPRHPARHSAAAAPTVPAPSSRSPARPCPAAAAAPPAPHPAGWRCGRARCGTSAWSRAALPAGCRRPPGTRTRRRRCARPAALSKAARTEPPAAGTDRTPPPGRCGRPAAAGGCGAATGPGRWFQCPGPAAVAAAVRPAPPWPCRRWSRTRRCAGTALAAAAPVAKMAGMPVPAGTVDGFASQRARCVRSWQPSSKSAKGHRCMDSLTGACTFAAISRKKEAKVRLPVSVFVRFCTFALLQKGISA